MKHQDIPVGEQAAHPIGYVQADDPGAVGAHKMWIDTSTAAPYQLKKRNAANSGWDAVGTTADPEDGEDGADGAQGFPGAPGPKGADGATWHDGAALPAPELGQVGDYYLHTPTADIYRKKSLVPLAPPLWVRHASVAVRGPEGPPGKQGPPGRDGAPGGGSGGSGGSSVTAATQAEQESAASLTTYVSPGRQQFHPSALKAWVEFDGHSPIVVGASYNVDSVTYRNPGYYDINLGTDFSSTHYAGFAGLVEDNTNVGFVTISTADAFAAGVHYIRTVSNGSYVEPDKVSVGFAGDQ